MSIEQKTQNLYGFHPADFGLPALGHPAWKESVHALQKSVGATVDGIFGVKTLGAAFRALFPGHMIVNGRPIRIDPPTRFRNWWETGMEHKNGRKMRTRKPCQIICHRGFECAAGDADSDGIGDEVERTHAYLEGKGYGSHFLVDREGDIFQTADPILHRLVHASGHNTQGIGIDWCGPLLPKGGERKPWPEQTLIKIPIDKKGRKVSFYDLTPLQKSNSIAVWLPRLALECGIKFKWPGDWYVHHVTSHYKEFNGILPHACVNMNRADGFVQLKAIVDIHEATR